MVKLDDRKDPESRPPQRGALGNEASLADLSGSPALMKGRSMNTTFNRDSEIPEPNITRFLFADRRMALVWLVVRVYLGYLWLTAGIGKIMEGGWIGEGVGGAVQRPDRRQSATGALGPEVAGVYSEPNAPLPGGQFRKVPMLATDSARTTLTPPCR